MPRPEIKAELKKIKDAIDFKKIVTPEDYELYEINKILDQQKKEDQMIEAQKKASKDIIAPKKNAKKFVPKNPLDKNMDKIKVLAFSYLNRMREDAFFDKHEKCELALAILGATDAKFAKTVERSLNRNSDLKDSMEFLNDFFMKEVYKSPISLKDSMNKFNAKQNEAEGVENYEGDIKNDVRVKNFNKLYKSLKNSRMFLHIDTPEFKEMLQSVKNVIDYAKLGIKNNKNIDKKVLDEMFKTAAVKAAKYAEAKPCAPSSDMGIDRLNAAIAIAYTVKPEYAQKMIDSNTQRRIDEHNEYIENNSELLFENPKKATKANFKDVIKLDRVIKDTGIIKVEGVQAKNTNVAKQAEAPKQENVAKQPEGPKYIHKFRGFDDVANRTPEFMERVQEFRLSNVEEAIVKWPEKRPAKLPEYIVMRAIVDKVKDVKELFGINIGNVEASAKKVADTEGFKKVFEKHAKDKYIDLEIFNKEVKEELANMKIVPENKPVKDNQIKQDAPDINTNSNVQNNPQINAPVGPSMN